MAVKIKPSILVFIVLILASASLACSGFYLLQKEKTNSASLQKAMDEVTLKQAQAEKKLDEAQKTIAGLEAKLKEANVNLSSLKDDLEAEKSAKALALKDAEDIKVTLAEQNKLKTELEDKLAKAQDETKKIKSDLKELENKKSALEKKVNELEEKLKSGVELGTIVVNPENASQPEQALQPEQVSGPEEPLAQGARASTPKASAPAATTTTGQEGKVLVVNKDYNFAVINLGAEDGIALGTVFSIYHNNKYLGEVKVEKVHDSMAAAAFLNPDLKDTINEGDRAVLKAK